MSESTGREVTAPDPEPLPPMGAPGRPTPLQQQDALLRELRALALDSPSLAQVREVADAVRAVSTAFPGVIEMIVETAQQIPSGDMIRQEVRAEAGTVVSRRVASATNVSPAVVPGTLAGGAVDVVLTLTPALADASYQCASPVLATSNLTLLGSVQVVGVTARTADTMTVRLRNTGATSLTVPAGALTAVAVRSTTT